VITRVFESHSGLQRKAFEKVGLKERELAPARGRHDEFGHFAAVAIVERINESS
jgi:hypothetical protein